jgi:LacI family transcriptional regulator
VTSLSEIARLVGVSTSTVSRALNRPEMVRPQLAAQVRALAGELGYVPNHFARSLRVQESKTLGLIVPDSTNPFFAEVARGLEAACFRAGYTLILCNSDRSVEKELAQARVLSEKRVDGVLLFSTSDASAATLEWLVERSLPAVLIERRSPGPAVDCVVSDNAAGVHAAIEHLASLGHWAIGCLMGDTGASHYAERLAAFSAAVRTFNLRAGDDLIQTGLATFADGQRAALELLALPHPPSALFCATDSLAVGATRAVHLAGKTVPRDVAVIGYGNTELTAYTQPPLTVVHQDKLAVGALAVRVLLDRIARRARGERWRPRTHVLPTRLVIRESTAGREAASAASIEPGKEVGATT